MRVTPPDAVASQSSHAGALAALKSDEDIVFHWRCTHRDGRAIDLDVSATRFELEGEEVILAIGRDVSERKKLQARMARAEKMQAIGTLAGGVAHDFNNLLMAIEGNASLLMVDTGDEPDDLEKLEAIQTAVRSGVELTRQLLGFARGGKYETRAIDLDAVIRRTSGLFARTREELRMHAELAADLRPVEADEGQLEQVLLNLFVNAWYAMPGGGQLLVATENEDLDGARAARGFSLPFPSIQENWGMARASLSEHRWRGTRKRSSPPGGRASSRSPSTPRRSRCACAR